MKMLYAYCIRTLLGQDDPQCTTETTVILLVFFMLTWSCNLMQSIWRVSSLRRILLCLSSWKIIEIGKGSNMKVVSHVLKRLWKSLYQGWEWRSLTWLYLPAPHHHGVSDNVGISISLSQCQQRYCITHANYSSYIWNKNACITTLFWRKESRCHECSVRHT